VRRHYDLLIDELKDTHLMVPEDTSKREANFYQIQRSCGTPSTDPSPAGYRKRLSTADKKNRWSCLSEEG
jgi:hypothetical protein